MTMQPRASDARSKYERVSRVLAALDEALDEMNHADMNKLQPEIRESAEHARGAILDAIRFARQVLLSELDEVARLNVRSQTPPAEGD